MVKVTCAALPSNLMGSVLVNFEKIFDLHKAYLIFYECPLQ